MVKFSKSIPKAFIATPTDMLCPNFVKFGRLEMSEIVCSLPDKNKTSPGSPAVATARIVPKICQGQPPTMYSNRFTFGGVTAKHVNTAKMRHKVNPIFGWSLASSRVTTKTRYDFSRLWSKSKITTTTDYLPEPLDLSASACVMSIDGATFPVVNVNLLHTAQHQLRRHTHAHMNTHNHVYTDTRLHKHTQFLYNQPLKLDAWQSRVWTRPARRFANTN